MTNATNTFLDKAKEIRDYEFPFMVKKRLKYMYPYLTTCDIDVVLDGLKDYFILILAGHMGECPVGPAGFGMPSVIIDDAWHLWILNTREYFEFCESVFGCYVHHIPDEETTDHIESRSDLLNVTNYKEDVFTAYNGYLKLKDLVTWTDEQLPILFMADNIFGVKDGFIYNKDVLAKVEAGL